MSGSFADIHDLAALVYLQKEQAKQLRALDCNELVNLVQEVAGKSNKYQRYLILLNQVLNQGVKYISVLDENFLPDLQVLNINLLFYVGDISLLKNKTKVGIIGSRRASSHSKYHASKVAGILASNGYVVVSGLAMGIDASAHFGAVDSRHGSTIAVLGNSLPGISPKQNMGLAKTIVDRGGLIVSQFLPAERTQRQNFLIRNRLIARISDSLIVPQAGSRSGSLHTVREALALGKQVYVLPGQFEDDSYAGSNSLLGDMAKVVANYENLKTVFKLKDSVDCVESEVYRTIYKEPGITLNQLIAYFPDLTFLQQEILRLENLDLIRQLPGNKLYADNCRIQQK